MHDDERPKPDGTEASPGELLDVESPSEDVVCMQLAARWAEMYTLPGSADTRAEILLRRFRSNFEYLDAVIHGVTPPDLT